ncbi:hypothetical protein HRbin01_00406 [archaeon HR01]|nr:hypothetical protein HRbin01_00406 [archaeon HR01]
MAHELSPKERPDILSMHRSVRDIIESLQKFVETEDYAYVERAFNEKERLKSHGKLEYISGFQDLESNLDTLYNSVKGGVAADFVHGRLVDQAVYTIVRANIIATGLEFKLKRMRKG